ncbi:glutaminase A [Kroppenstedtia pulmonis]|uniref:Glutaminase n=1 Tax=Kroppenstedtia pulmonis TaxID=1380685 RepID=A0A7D3XQY8_9BACL|nr:glutaminase A [Kroppenstedtia pulmonis]QKG85207.1 glutaminase A [Kroppenstedtia pulmonis]
MQALLEELVKKNRSLCKEGKVADYIPELKKQNPFTLSITVVTPKGETYQAGDCSHSFTLQSISKVLTLILALMDHSYEKVFHHVGMEPTGDPFNSIYKLEMNQPGKPLNPMINAGALAVTSLIQGESVAERLERLLCLIRAMTGNPDISLNEDVYRSEAETAYRNRSLAYFLKEFGIIGDVEETLELYFKQCSIAVTCHDLAQIGLCLAQKGKNATGEQVLPVELDRLIKTFMVTCGMYNASGEFAIKAGIPAKSGVSGGIMAAVPHKMGIGVFGPSLDEKGNSIAGFQLLQDLSASKNLSVF